MVSIRKNWLSTISLLLFIFFTPRTVMALQQTQESFYAAAYQQQFGSGLKSYEFNQDAKKNIIGVFEYTDKYLNKTFDAKELLAYPHLETWTFVPFEGFDKYIKTGIPLRGKHLYAHKYYLYSSDLVPSLHIGVNNKGKVEGIYYWMNSVEEFFVVKTSRFGYQIDPWSGHPTLSGINVDKDSYDDAIDRGAKKEIEKTYGINLDDLNRKKEMIDYDPIESECTIDGGILEKVLGGCKTPASKDHVSELFKTVTDFLLSIAAAIVVIFTIISGYKIMMAGSSGNPKEIGAAKSGLTAAIVGLIIIILARFIVLEFIRLLTK